MGFTVLTVLRRKKSQTAVLKITDVNSHTSDNFQIGLPAQH